MPSDALAENKKLVADYVESFYNRKDFDNAKLLLAEDFANHHHGVGTGRERTVETFREMVADRFPEFSLTILRTVAEGDLVWTHGVVRIAPGVPPSIVVDIWRVRDGLLAEHWDVGQSVPDGATLDELV
ncbi:nuclear transport factor 2 family protein [Actinokineospora sp. PR83]|uniref:nuclear transport factor 2 family protein n=1 Tax=Actinokineospora sp. PR83 TaxID=2884908 RepID=UPI001F328D77|nr:nuclear transport factor 2 family protein [Actinokineospora sp. PR83]MCG8916565.1 nuclear transport factor 2 family protein [Actinokineospora sp. PR83]